MKKITITYKEADSDVSRGRMLGFGTLKISMKDGTWVIDMPGLPSMGPGILLVDVEDARPRRKPKKEPGRTGSGPQGRGGFIETQSGKPRKTKPKGVKEEQ